MIRIDAELRGETSFRDWASQFSGKYFVMIQIYADESGTHDPDGMLKGSQYPIVGGFAARKSTWDKFCPQWSAILKKYDDAPYFHGRELKAAREAIVHNKPESKELLKNPYYIRRWGLEKIKSFLNALTKLAAADNKIPIAGGINIGTFNRIRTGLFEQNPYKYVISHFFTVYHQETALQWGNFKSEVSFFFDRPANNEWRDAVFEVFYSYQKHDTRMRGPYFDDKEKLVPLQAADLVAYRMRKLLEDAMNDRLELEDLDIVLLGNLLKSAMIKHPELKPLLEKNKRIQKLVSYRRK